MVKKYFIFSISLLMLISVFAGASDAAPKTIALMLNDADDSEGTFGALCIEGLKNAEANFGKRKIKTKVYNAEGDKEKMPVLLKEAAESSSLVIAAYAGYVPYMHEMAEKYPDCRFVVFESEGVKDTDGLTEIIFREEEGGFLAGALAVLISAREDVDRVDDKRIIGIILGEDVPAVRRFERGFAAGAWYVDPKTTVLKEVTGDFSDREKAAAAAAKLKAEGADVIFCVNGAAQIGVINNAEEKGYWVIGVDGEMEKEYPKSVLASVVKRTGNGIYYVIKSYLENRLSSGKYYMGADRGVVDISIWTREAKQNIPFDIRQKLNEIGDKLSEGLIKIEQTDYQGMKEK